MHISKLTYIGQISCIGTIGLSYACMVVHHDYTLLIVHHAQIGTNIYHAEPTAASCHYESIYYYACSYIASYTYSYNVTQMGYKGELY